jgi:hypothetical protein
LEFRVWALRLRVQGNEFGFEGSELMVQDSGVRVSGLRVKDLGCRI